MTIVSKLYAIFFSFKCRSPFFGSMHSCWLHTGHELSPSKVRVAADYSDSLPDSPRHVGNRGYHSLEEVKDHERNKDMLLTDAEIARTTVEVILSCLGDRFLPCRYICNLMPAMKLSY